MTYATDPVPRNRRRHHLVTGVVADIDRRGLAGLTDWHEAIAREYGDDDLGGLLVDVQCRWQRTFDARLDGLLENGPADLQQAVRRLWESMSKELAGARLLLDAYAGHPALVRVQSRHHRMLAAVTGVRATDLLTDQTQPRTSNGATHGRQHRPRPGRLRVRPVCRRLHRRPVPAA